MALTPSNMPDLGKKAVDFKLPNVLGGELGLSEVKGDKGLLVAFICNHCPYVIHIQSVFVELANSWLDRGVGVVAISANDVVTHPQDSPEAMAALAQSAGFKFPYLYDESQEIAKAYSAACTPDFFLYNEENELVYRGQFDAARPGSDTPVTGSDLSQAIERLLHGQPPLEQQTPSIGCNIKWK